MITLWAVRSILHARARFLGTASAVGAAMLLVVVFRAVWEGETRQLATYPGRTGADVWVMQKSVSNMHMASSFIPRSKRVEIERVEGVDSLDAILYLNTMLEAGNRPWFSYVVGLDRVRQIGGPWSLPGDTRELGEGEAIIPETLARITDTKLGDRVRIGGRDFTVGGLAEETFSATNPITFVRAEDLADLLSLSRYDSYVLVRAAEGVSADVLAERIRTDVDGVATMTTDALVASDVELSRQMGTEVIAVMTAICGLLAVLLIGFSLHIHAAGLRRDLALLTALGFGPGAIYRSAVIQSSLLTGAGFALAVAGAGSILVVGPYLAPVLSLTLPPMILVQVGAAGLAVALVATLSVARQIVRVDPASVFNG